MDHIRIVLSRVDFITALKNEEQQLIEWFPESASPVADKIDHLFWYVTSWTGVTGLIFVAILGTFIIKYRRRGDRKAFYTHGDTRGALLLTLTLAFLVFVLLDMNFAYKDDRLWKSMFGTPPLPGQALKIEVMPQQFAWNVRYAGPDGEFGTADDIVTINDLHVIAGKPVVVQLTSKDVIHSFFLPSMRLKQDAIPGMVTSIYFTPEKIGNFDIACAQHCGLGHYRMRGALVIDSQQAFDSWVLAQSSETAASDAAPWGWDWNRGLAPRKA